MDARGPACPVKPLRDLILFWLGTQSRGLELSALAKDCDALLAACPSLPPPLLLACDGAAASLVALVSALSTLVRREVAPSLARAGLLQQPGQVVSPYAGGVPVGNADPARHAAEPGSQDSIHLAVLNPGRLGFLALGTDVFLEWRLHAVAHVLSGCGADICVLPGARLPPGAVLPAGFPFSVSYTHLTLPTIRSV